MVAILLKQHCNKLAALLTDCNAMILPTMPVNAAYFEANNSKMSPLHVSSHLVLTQALSGNKGSNAKEEIEKDRITSLLSSIPKLLNGHTRLSADLVGNSG